jgi:pSer/pThr/pTyr-binding forkhead associated (FHA) protein
LVGTPLPPVTPPPSTALPAPEVGRSPSKLDGAATPSPDGSPARITIRRGGTLTSDSFEICGAVVIGRFDFDSGPVDIDLAKIPEADYLSRRHAEIFPREKEWLLKDLGSQNGTFHKKSGATQFVRVTSEQVLAPGDEIAFGNVRFEFQSC